MDRGLVHIYTGDGKGKTSAAAGLAARCAVRGKKVVFCRFLKAGKSGETEALKRLGAEIKSFSSSQKFWFQMNADEKALAKSETENALAHIYDVECDLLVLDEIMCVADLGIVSVEFLAEIIEKKPHKTELVLTGRGAPEQLYKYADYVSEIRCVKHPYEKNIGAREGIEF